MENAPDGSFICPDGESEGQAQQMADLSGRERMGQHFNVEGAGDNFTSQVPSVG